MVNTVSFLFKDKGMKSQLTIALVQADCHWEDASANREHLTQLLAQVPAGTDVAILPEMFSSGFSMHPERMAESMKGPTLLWMKTWAKTHQCVLAGSLAISEGGYYFNRFVWVTPQGEVHSYDKRYGFSLAGEDKVYKAGQQPTVFEYNGWRICPRICYDLRFPLWARNTQNYDVVVFVANWPEPRIHAWDTLLQARAIENLSYGIGVNRVGKDPNGNQYPGHTAAYDALGHKMTNDLKGKEGCVTVVLDRDPLHLLRKQLNFLADRDEFVWDQKLD